ncbi:MAG TPA: hypothetical protein VHA53_08395, partial [Nitrolancea sp.]|nr:hypothetical protein [Nitrolancea sp.]
SGPGVIGVSSTVDGVQGFTSATGRFGVLGNNTGSGAGVEATNSGTGFALQVVAVRRRGDPRNAARLDRRDHFRRYMLRERTLRRAYYCRNRSRCD